MLIDANAPLCDCDVTIPLLEEDDNLVDAVFNLDDEDDEGFSLVSHTGTQNADHDPIDEVKADNVSSSLMNESTISSQKSVASEDAMSSSSIASVEHITVMDIDEFAEMELRLTTDSAVETKKNVWTKRELFLLFCVGLSFLLVTFAFVVTFRTIQDSRQCKLQVQMQNVVASKFFRNQEKEIIELSNHVERLQMEAISMEETYKEEIRQAQNDILGLQEFVSSTQHQEEVIQQLEEQIHRLQSEAAEVKVASEKEDRRVKRRIRDVQAHFDKMRERAEIYEQFYTISSGQIDDWRKKYEKAMDSSEKCQNRMHRLKKETKHAVAEARNATKELRKISKELAQSTGAVIRQKETIQKLKKKLSEAEERKQRRQKEAPAGAAFPWESADDSVLVDNCWLYLKAKMDVGECVWDMKDNVKDQVMSFGRSFNEAFRNFRKEFKQFHSSEKSLYQSHKKLWNEFEKHMGK